MASLCPVLASRVHPISTPSWFPFSSLCLFLKLDQDRFPGSLLQSYSAKVLAQQRLRSLDFPTGSPISASECSSHTWR
ncbi:hypothetical protein L345_03740, partial [Ophiophagus hannah]